MAAPVTDGVCICVMAKAPRPGTVKTRMCPPLTPHQAARVAEAFVLDTWTAARAAGGDHTYLATAGPHAWFPQVLRDVPWFPQRGDDLGARIESVVAAGLERAAGVIVVGSDLPGLPVARLHDARRVLGHTDVVLGPTGDGGFYLLAARSHRPDMLAGIPWSTSDTHAMCRRRLEDRGFCVAEIERFDDVDDVAGVRRLREDIDAGTVHAPACRALFSEPPWPSLLSSPS